MILTAVSKIDNFTYWNKTILIDSCDFGPINFLIWDMNIFGWTWGMVSWICFRLIFGFSKSHLDRSY